MTEELDSTHITKHQRETAETSRQRPDKAETEEATFDVPSHSSARQMPFADMNQGRVGEAAFQANVQHMQHIHGNQYVQRIIQRSTEMPKQEEEEELPAQRTIQRSAEMPQEEEEENVAQRTVQRSTEMSQEEEEELPAQSTIQRSTEMPEEEEEELPAQRTIQRTATADNDTARQDKTIAQRIEAKAGSGNNLDPNSRDHLEQHLGADLSGVRVHTDSEADDMARSVNSVAFTTGQDIFFRSGTYNPSSEQGLHLLAHEATHTVQQSRGPVAGTTGPGGVALSDPSDSFEQAAEQTAFDVFSTQSSRVQKLSNSMQFTPIQSVNKEKTFVQRQDGAGATNHNEAESEREKIQKALKSKDPGDVKDIQNVNKATEEEKLQLIGILAYQGWVGPRDERKLEELWGSLGDRLSQVLIANNHLWLHCIEAGAELDEIYEVKKTKKIFLTDVTAIAAGNLTTNHAFVLKEMERFGISQDEKVPSAPLKEEQTKDLQEMQKSAEVVSRLQKQQENMRGIPVGYYMTRPLTEGDQGAMQLASFDPYQPPKNPPLKDDKRVRSWEEVKKKYDEATSLITTETTRFPSLYSVSREGKSDVTATFANTGDVEQARNQLGKGLQKLLKDIEGAQNKLGTQLNPLDLTPIHQQLLNGTAAPSGTQWSQPFAQWAAQDQLKDHKVEQFWIKLGLDSLAAAAFLAAPFTGGTSAGVSLSLLVNTVGLSLTLQKANIEAKHNEAVTQASQTAIKPGTDIVDPGEVSVSQTAAEAALIEAAVAAFMVGLETVSSVGKTSKNVASNETIEGKDNSNINPPDGEQKPKDITPETKSNTSSPNSEASKLEVNSGQQFKYDDEVIELSKRYNIPKDEAVALRDTLHKRSIPPQNQAELVVGEDKVASHFKVNRKNFKLPEYIVRGKNGKWVVVEVKNQNEPDIGHAIAKFRDANRLIIENYGQHQVGSYNLYIKEGFKGFEDQSFTVGADGYLLQGGNNFSIDGVKVRVISKNLGPHEGSTN